MKTRLFVIFAAILTGVGGCIPSVSPFFTAKDLVFEDRLLGEWQEKEEKEDPELWKFESAKEGEKAYLLTVTEKKGKEGTFQAHLLKLEGELFLDIRAAEIAFAPEQAELAACTIVPGHLLLRVRQIGPELKLAFFDFDWLSKRLKEQPNALAHHKEEDRMVLTAGIKELQEFVLKHLNEGLFQEGQTMIRSPRNVDTAAIQSP